MFEPAEGNNRTGRPRHTRKLGWRAWREVTAARIVGSNTLKSVKRALLTGMSGTGMSSVVRELVARGSKAIDTFILANNAIRAPA